MEDNQTDEKLALLAIRKSEVPTEVVVARDGQQALDTLFGEGAPSGDGHPLPALVLLDLNLARVSGFEVLRQLRAGGRTRHLPVLVMTTSTREGDIRQSYDLGANGYLRKPGDYREFAAAIKTTLTFWLQINQVLPVPAAVPPP